MECVFTAARGHGLDRLVARMTPDRSGSISLFESLAFRAEALVEDHVRGRDDVAHDLAILAILAYDAARVAAQHRGYGTA